MPMTPYLLSKLVGDPAAPGNTPQLCAMPMWFGLSSQNPANVGDPKSVEVVDPNYHRIAAAWNAFGQTGLTNASDVDFHGLQPGVTVAAVTVWDALTNGNLLAYDTQVNDFLAGGGMYLIAQGQFVFGFDLVTFDDASLG